MKQERTHEEPFIAINILANSLEELIEQSAYAAQLGFTHAWINPINDLKPLEEDEGFSKKDPITGVSSRFYQSKYGIVDPTKFSKSFGQVDDCRNAITKMKEEHGITILCDFVWMYVDKFEGRGREKNKKLTRNDINSLKKSAEIILDKKKGYGFGGIRIDATSHIDNEVRLALVLHIKKKYPEAIIFEEVLFDRNVAGNVDDLVRGAKESDAYSDFVTSNLYYQTPDVFGTLPHSKDMGDTTKLQLSQGRAISFTGNHDHYSLAWGIVMQLAAKRFNDEESSANFIKKIEATKVYPNNYRPFKSFKNLRGAIKNFSDGKGASDDKTEVTQFLYPFAVEIAKELLEGSNEKLFQQFKEAVFTTIVNRTLLSPSGYFMLFADLSASLKTPCIFTNKYGRVSELFLISAEDLLKDRELLDELASQMQGTKDAFENLANFRRNSSILNSRSTKKAKKKKGKKAKAKISKDPVETLNDALLFLPYVTTHLRACYPFSDGNLNAWLDERKITPEKEEAFAKKLGIVDFIKSINEIFSKLTTHDSHDYHTVVSRDHYKVIVRCSEKSTDIIIINLNSDKTMTVDMIEIQKITAWFQARKFSTPDNDHKTNLFTGPGLVVDGKVHEKINVIVEQKSDDAFEQTKEGAKTKTGVEVILTLRATPVSQKSVTDNASSLFSPTGSSPPRETNTPKPTTLDY